MKVLTRAWKWGYSGVLAAIRADIGKNNLHPFYLAQAMPALHDSTLHR